MMVLDIGRLYEEAIKKAGDDEECVFGHLPLMASCSTGQIGALLAESFCECCTSVSKTVINKKLQCLSDEEIELLW